MDKRVTDEVIAGALAAGAERRAVCIQLNVSEWRVNRVAQDMARHRAFVTLALSEK